jgi:hypothetical protein
MGWAVSEQHIKQAQHIDKEYPIIADLLFYGYFVDYPTRIHTISILDAYLIQDTSYLAISG